MADEISLNGKKYISSKRASELSGYTQDYIGQLARTSQIDAQRVGGLWYIQLDSLNRYKSQAENYRPEFPENSHTEPPDTVVNFDGTDYVSAARASKITGYNQDYVGQLARLGKIKSHQVGNRWFVSRTAIEAHKRQKDALLAAVQTEAVGVREYKPDQKNSDFGTFFSYISESSSAPIFPEASTEFDPVADGNDKVAQSSVDRHAIPIRVTDQETGLSETRVWNERKQRTPLRNSSFYKTIMLSAFTVVVVLTVGLASLKDKSLYALGTHNMTRLESELASSGTLSTSLQRIAEAIERVLGHQLIYKQAE